MNLIRLLPDYYENNTTMIMLQAALSEATDQLEENLTDTVDQCFVATATRLLYRWEKILGLSTDISKPIAFRRERINAKLAGFGTATKAMIADVSRQYSNGEAEVIEDNANSTFTIRFTGTIGIPENMEDLKETIEEIKPAHLAVKYEYIYNTYKNLSALTHADLENYTHSQLRNEVLENGN